MYLMEKVEKGILGKSMAPQWAKNKNIDESQAEEDGRWAGDSARAESWGPGLSCQEREFSCYTAADRVCLSRHGLLVAPAEMQTRLASSSSQCWD